MFWLKKVDSQLARLKDMIFGNQEIRQLELWNLAQRKILSLVPGKVLWRKCRGGLGAKITRALMWNHYISPSPSELLMFYQRVGHALGHKLFLEENKVKNKSWNLVLISTDMDSIVSPQWDNDFIQNLTSS